MVPFNTWSSEMSCIGYTVYFSPRLFLVPSWLHPWQKKSSGCKISGVGQADIIKLQNRPSWYFNSNCALCCLVSRHFSIVAFVLTTLDYKSCFCHFYDLHLPLFLLSGQELRDLISNTATKQGRNLLIPNGLTFPAATESVLQTCHCTLVEDLTYSIYMAMDPQDLVF